MPTLRHLQILVARGSVVAEALHYKPEGPGFKTGRGERISSIYLILPAALVPGIYSASNINKNQKKKKLHGLSPRANYTDRGTAE
jgi:hypothetical protein